MISIVAECNHDHSLQPAAVDNSRGIAIFDVARAAPGSFNRLHNLLRCSVLVVDLAEDNVFAIKPASHDCGDKEL